MRTVVYSVINPHERVFDWIDTLKRTCYPLFRSPKGGRKEKKSTHPTKKEKVENEVKPALAAKFDLSERQNRNRKRQEAKLCPYEKSLVCARGRAKLVKRVGRERLKSKSVRGEGRR